MKHIFTAFFATFVFTAMADEPTYVWSFDMQLRQASDAIGQLAAAGLHQQELDAASMDLQIKIASDAIDKIATEGRQ